MNTSPTSVALPIATIPGSATSPWSTQEQKRQRRSIDSSPSRKELIPGQLSEPDDKRVTLGQKPIKDLIPHSTHESDVAKFVIYGSASTSPPETYSQQERLQRADAFADRVVTQLENIESGNEGESNIRFQKSHQFLEPAGYFSGGLLAAGFDPHEKITTTFTSYVGRGRPENLTNTNERTYFAWEIAAGALAHDKVQRGGPINFNFMSINDQDRSKVADLESLGSNLQKHWEREVATPMRKDSGALAKRSGKADAYVTRGTLQSLANDKDSFQKLSPEGQAAVTRTLKDNGQVIIPNIYGYPMAGYAFIAYTPYDGNYDHRPNHGVMIDLKNGTVQEIKGDKAFAGWAKNNRDPILRSFNGSDRQGGKDAHWPKAGDVLDNLIAGNYANYPGYSSLLKDKAVPVSETFNYTNARGGNYRLKYGDLGSSIAGKFQEGNAKNAVWSDQTEVFGSSQQNWKAAKDFWGNTFGYVPAVGNTGNIVFGIHDSIYGMTADDRVGGNAAAVISGLQLLHEVVPVGVEAGLGEPPIVLNSSANQHYNWRFNSQNSEFELVRTPNAATHTEPEPNAPTPQLEVIPGGPAKFSYVGMREVEFRGRAYFAAEKPDAGDGVHYLLRVPDPIDPSKLVSSGIIAAPDELGTWKRMGVEGGSPLSTMFAKNYRSAREALDTFISKYMRAREGVPPTQADIKEFSDALTTIADGNVERFDLVERYVAADSDFVNRPLRAGKSTPEVEQFLAEFSQLDRYDGKAYRSAFVTPEGAQQIRNGVGKVFQDAGVQSASVTALNAQRWESWAGDVAMGRNNATQRVVYIFDETVPKKNLSSKLLKDQVAIPPGQITKILAVKEKGDTLFVYMSSPSKAPDHVYNIFNGKQIL